LEGKLRIGLAEKTLVVALAHAMVLKEIGSYFGVTWRLRLTRSKLQDELCLLSS
jgi:hypothetical protein